MLATGKKILSSDYFKSVFRLTVGSLIAQLITALVSPISTRLYKPEQLAVYTLILTVSSMFGPVLCGKYDMAIVSAKDEKEVTNLIVGGLAVSAVSITLVTMGYRFYLQKKPEILEEVGRFAYLLVAILIINALINLLNRYNNRHKEYKLISSVYVLRTGFQNIGLVLFGFLKLGSLGLLLSQILGSLVGLKRQSKRLIENRSVFKDVKLSEVKDTLLKHKKLPIYSMPAHFLNSASYSMLNFYITELFGLGILGYYSITYRILGIPLTLVSLNVSKVFFQRASEEKNKTGAYRRTLMQLTLFLACLSIPMVLVLVTLGPFLFELFFGEGWGVAGIYAQILAPMYGLRFIVSALTPALVISGEQRLELVLQSLFIITSIISYVVCSWTGYGINIFLLFISVFYSIIYIMLYMVIFKLSKKRQ